MSDTAKYGLVGVAVLLLVFGIYAIVHKGSGSQSTQTQSVPTSRSEILQVRAEDVVRGDANAPITIIDYSDYQCPYCVTYDKTLQQVVAAYPTQVRWVYRNYPLSFHQAARGAALAAEAAGLQGKYWEMSDKMVEKSQPDGTGLSEGDLSTYAQEIGLNIDQWKQDLSSQKISGKIDYDVKTGANLQISGTPASYLISKNGNIEELAGALTFDELKAKIDVALAK